MTKLKVTSSLVIGGLLLLGCGGGSSSSDTNSPQGNTNNGIEKNVALSTNGALAAATSNANRASLVNDGDNTPNNDWSPQNLDDLVGITFDKVYAVNNITIYLNKANNQDTQLEVSEDGVSWQDLSYTGDCSTLQMSGASGVDAAKIECGFSNSKVLKAIRYRILDGVINNSTDSLAIYEIEVTGK